MTTNKRIVCAVAALSMVCSSVAFAQQDKDVMADRAGAAERAGRGVDPGPSRPGYDRQGYPTRGYPRQDHDRRGDDRRGDDRRGDNWRPGSDRRNWGAGPDHNFYRGGRLPQYYRGHEYVVDDWREHRLHQPPRGYHWVQVGGDYVLVAIATGIIASILLNQ